MVLQRLSTHIGHRKFVGNISSTGFFDIVIFFTAAVVVVVTVLESEN